MDAHRCVSPTSFTVYDLKNPFSCFDFVDNNFPAFPSNPLSGGIPSARRIFSLARAFNAQTLIMENIPAKGMIATENDAIARVYSDYHTGPLHRLSFWRKGFKTIRGLDNAEDTDLIGYAILKRDILTTKVSRGEWHVFESVFPKYNHRHNCVPNPNASFLLTARY